MKTMTDQKIRWGIIGPGSIAKAFQGGVAGSQHGVLAAVATRDPNKPGLATDFPGAKVVHGYDALLADPDIDAVYIAVPHTGHAEWAIKAAEAGKHVLVEKPFALSAFEIDAVFHAHRKAGTFAGEAFMYRLHPQTAKLGELIRSGAIGEVRMIQSSFGFSMGKFQPQHRLFASSLAGGGIGRGRISRVDVALYCGPSHGQGVCRSGQGVGHGQAQCRRHRRLGSSSADV